MQALGDMLQELRICRIRSVADVNVCLDVMGKKLVRAEGVGAHIRIALGAQNRLLRYGRDIRYQKRPPTVRNCASVIAFYDVWKEATGCSLQGHN